MNGLTLLTDQPLGEGNAIEHDGLGFKAYAEVLGNAALGTSGPFTIGVFGEWGTGKTSLMKMIEHHIENDKNVITVWFNAWRYEKEEHPIVPLVATIVRGLESKKGILEKFGDAGKKLVRALRAVAYGFSSKATIKMPGFAELETAFVAKDMIEREEHLTPDPLLDRSLYFEAFKALSEVKLNEKHRVIVIIDDLDRCFPDQAIKLLESIKLVLSQPGFIFILGVSPTVIEGYLQHRYRKEYGIEGFTGHTYLDKIVQLPFLIPPHDGRMEMFSKAVLQRIEKSDDKHALEEILPILEEILPIIGVACGNNPRSTVRFINNLLIDRGIDRALSIKEKEGEEVDEVDIGYFAISRSLQQRWPNIFSLLSTSDQLCYELSEWKKDTEPKEVKKSESLEDKEIRRILSLDPDLKDLLLSNVGRRWLRNAKLRKRSIYFLLTTRSEPYLGSVSCNLYACYQASNKDDVSKVMEILEDNGIQLFRDQNYFNSDDKQILEIMKLELKKSFAILVFFDTTESIFIQQKLNEIERDCSKLLNYRIPVVSIFLPECDAEAELPALKNHIYFDFRNQEDLDEKLLVPLIDSLVVNRRDYISSLLMTRGDMRSSIESATWNLKTPEGRKAILDVLKELPVRLIENDTIRILSELV